MNLVRDSGKQVNQAWGRYSNSDHILAMSVLDRHKELWDSALRVTALAIQMQIAKVFPHRFPSEVGDEWRRARDTERPRFARLFRDIFGNPFRPVEFDPRWRTADAVGMARAIYEDRAFDRLPLLAGAL